MNRIRSLIVAILVLVPAAARGGEQPTLSVVVHGINSRGTDMFGEIGTMREQGTTWRIELAKESRPRDGRGLFQYLVDSGGDPPGTQVIRVRDANDPALAKFIERIAQERNATVAIDMDLPVVFADSAGRREEVSNWKRQTDEAAAIAVKLGQARAKAAPTSENTILAHSAGTVALSKIIDGAQGALYKTKIAASPMTWSLSSDVLILQAPGDLPATPTGRIRDLLPLDSPTRDVDGWLGHGNTVVRLNPAGFNVRPSSLLSSLLPAQQPLKAHSESHQLNLDHDVEVFVPVSTQKPGEPPSPMRVERFSASNVKPGSILHALEAKGGASGLGSPAGIDKLRNEIKSLEPPKGGGVALHAAAVVPVESGSIVNAEWDDAASSVVLALKDGKRLRLPAIDRDLARVAWRAVFGSAAGDPEFSIGAPLQAGTSDLTARGYQPCYYKGPIDGTIVGLILSQADVALGNIAYGGTRELARYGLDRVPGFHSLAEMFPGKYAAQPAQDRYIGIDERVVIESLPARLEREGDTFRFAPVQELAVRFGRTTPAERGFADLFGAHYQAVLDHVPPLARLLDVARAIGVFKWISEEGILLVGSAALRAEPQTVLTPHQVESRQRVALEDLSPSRPFVLFGPEGPEALFPAVGDPIEITYQRGRVHAIRYPDGRSMQVATDDLGQILAVSVTGIGDSVYTREPDNYEVVADVELLRTDGKITGFRPQPGSSTAPEANPWEIVDALAHRFLGSIP